MGPPFRDVVVKNIACNLIHSYTHQVIYQKHKSTSKNPFLNNNDRYSFTKCCHRSKEREREREREREKEGGREIVMARERVYIQHVQRCIALTFVQRKPLSRMYLKASTARPLVCDVMQISKPTVTKY